MAGFDMEFPDDLLSGLLNTPFETICEEALNEAVPILEKSTKEEVKKVLEHDGDSELVNSFKAGKAKKAKNGAWIVNVSPKGYSKTHIYTAKNGKGERTKRKYPISNALKAIWKEYGIAGQQAAKPFLGKATRNAEKNVLDTMQKVYEKKVGAE